MKKIFLIIMLFSGFVYGDEDPSRCFKNGKLYCNGDIVVVRLHGLRNYEVEVIVKVYDTGGDTIRYELYRWPLYNTDRVELDYSSWRSFYKNMPDVIGNIYTKSYQRKKLAEEKTMEKEAKLEEIKMKKREEICQAIAKSKTDMIENNESKHISFRFVNDICLTSLNRDLKYFPSETYGILNEMTDINWK